LLAYLLGIGLAFQKRPSLDQFKTKNQDYAIDETRNRIIKLEDDFCSGVSRALIDALDDIAALKPASKTWEAERALLGFIMHDPTVYQPGTGVAEFLTANYFYYSAHQMIFDAIIRFAGRDDIDLALLTDYFQKNNLAEVKTELMDIWDYWYHLPNIFDANPSFLKPHIVKHRIYRILADLFLGKHGPNSERIYPYIEFLAVNNRPIILAGEHISRALETVRNGGFTNPHLQAMFNLGFDICRNLNAEEPSRIQTLHEQAFELISDIGSVIDFPTLSNTKHWPELLPTLMHAIKKLLNSRANPDNAGDEKRTTVAATERDFYPDQCSAATRPRNENPTAQRDDGTTETSLTELDQPCWDKKKGWLYRGGRELFFVKESAPNMRAILNALQEAGWPRDEGVEVPGLDPTQLNDTKSDLNEKSKKILFQCDGTGKGIKWNWPDA